jgi:hypothetical protein
MWLKNSNSSGYTQVRFGKTAVPGSTYGASDGVIWDLIGWKWRVVKSSNPLGIGTGLATDDQAGAITSFTNKDNGTTTTSTPIFESGTYTPVVNPATLNIAGTPTVPAPFVYSRVGNIVTVAGSFGVDVDPPPTLSAFNFSLPIASNFTSEYDCVGQVNRYHGIAAPQDSGEIVGNVADDEAAVTWNSSQDGGARRMVVNFQYIIK